MNCQCPQNYRPKLVDVSGFTLSFTFFGMIPSEEKLNCERADRRLASLQCLIWVVCLVSTYIMDIQPASGVVLLVNYCSATHIQCVKTTVTSISAISEVHWMDWLEHPALSSLIGLKMDRTWRSHFSLDEFWAPEEVQYVLRTIASVFLSFLIFFFTKRIVYSLNTVQCYNRFRCILLFWNTET